MTSPGVIQPTKRSNDVATDGTNEHNLQHDDPVYEVPPLKTLHALERGYTTPHLHNEHVLVK